MSEKNSMPKFEVWQFDTLVKFAYDACAKMEEQSEQIARLQVDLRDTRRAYRELILLTDDDGK